MLKERVSFERDLPFCTYTPFLGKKSLRDRLLNASNTYYKNKEKTIEFEYQCRLLYAYLCVDRNACILMLYFGLLEVTDPLLLACFLVKFIMTTTAQHHPLAYVISYGIVYKSIFNPSFISVSVYSLTGYKILHINIAGFEQKQQQQRIHPNRSSSFQKFPSAAFYEVYLHFILYYFIVI